MAILSALYNLGKSLAEGPSSADSYMDKAYNARKAGDNKLAAELYSNAIAAGRETWVAYFYRGECRLAAGDKSGAIGDFEKAIEIDPKHSGQAQAALDKARN